jgi:2-C-methyl-D-erythritol 4-phosphate cytidylyltransferase
LLDDGPWRVLDAHLCSPGYIHDVTTTPSIFDGRPDTGAAIGVVPVCHDDREAPAGCAALRELRGRSLLVRSVAALRRSGAVGPIVVAVPPVLVPVVEQLLRDAADLADLVGTGQAAADVLPVHENGHGYGVRAVLREVGIPADRPVVTHDPLYPLAPAALVREVVEVLVRHGAPQGDGPQPAPCVAAVPVRPVTDTLKWIDEDDVVLGTADREQFRMVYSPQAYWPDGLRAIVEEAGPEQLRAAGADVLPRLVQAAGGHLLPVPAPGEVFRLSTEEDLVLADAMLHVGSGADDEAQVHAG